MPRQLTDSERADFLAQPHIAVLSVASNDGRPPLTVPVWYASRADGELTFFTNTQGRTSRKTLLLHHAGQLSLCVQQPQFPYKYVTAECTVVRADRSPSFDEVFAITSRYLPEEAARQFAEAEAAHLAGVFVLFTAHPDRWLSADFSDA
ncbi:pyridoxamine 5'-phosphate oxidase family protein [Allokutzneria sp. NRRL B-24872]|uniref:pyridoxamine 5'-phosphate oxidase family protein n=1 Tax=Allokutzneria sp. NRRL B-24872 TaxID=1137961 RepID=UPI000A367D75|nr:pyridoxamine 5'-phosphate oxidase family protein [Allokutzneria sp. NRRL B-24872]